MELIPPCPVCGGHDAAPFGTARGAGPHLHETQVRCRACGLVAALPQASDAARSAYYEGAYYESRWADAEPLFATNRVAYARTLWPLFVAGWSGFAPSAGASVFEVGCGYGALLAVLRDRGFDVHGVEAGPRAAAFCRAQGFDVRTSLDADASDAGCHDVAIAAYVLEHVSDPATFLRKLTGLVRVGGAVVIVTDAIWTTQHVVERARAALGRARAPYRTSTDHTYVFSPRHLRVLFERARCEQVSVRAFTDPAPRESWHWKAYKGACRVSDRLLGLGEYLMAVGRRVA